ncbi:MAG: DUF433 domain-containing protein [Chloroflexi bacterium]|nr:DUF433 domain-containing protein [Chloroflexota bacterium]
MKWIVADPEHLGGAPRVRDTRISIALLLELLSTGMTIPEIVKEYPSLSEEAVRGALAELAHSELLAVR